MCGLHQTFTRLTSVPNDPQYPATWRTIPAGAISEYVAHEEVVETLRATSLQDGIATLDVKSLPAGVYVLRVKDATSANVCTGIRQRRCRNLPTQVQELANAGAGIG